MKPLLIKVIFITILTLGLNGCYTIIWSPDMEFPTEENYESDIYYGDVYYGDYSYFYDYPWWLDIVPPAATQTAGSRDENNNIQNIRNIGERGIPTGTPDLQPTSHNAPPITTNTNGNNNSGRSSTESTVRNSSSGSGSNNGRGSTSGSGNNTRNNNGGRGSGGEK